MLLSIYDADLRAGIVWAMWAGWRGTVTFTHDGQEFEVWKGTAHLSHKEAMNEAQAQVNRFMLVRPRCNGQGCKDPVVWIDVASLIDDGLDGTAWYSTPQCWSDVMAERF